MDALLAASKVLAKKRATASHFGNGGEVANLLSEAKLRKEGRGDGSMTSRRAHGFLALLVSLIWLRSFPSPPFEIVMCIRREILQDQMV